MNVLENATAHADWFVEQMRWVYVQAFVHGDKHGYKRGYDEGFKAGREPGP